MLATTTRRLLRKIWSRYHMNLSDGDLNIHSKAYVSVPVKDITRIVTDETVTTIYTEHLYVALWRHTAIVHVVVREIPRGD